MSSSKVQTLRDIICAESCCHSCNISLKKAPPEKVDKSSWEQLIGLYPYLVDCTTTASTQVSHSLREALLQYSDLLQPPASHSYQNGFIKSTPDGSSHNDVNDEISTTCNFV
ncbi:hypothetical protein L9F63_022623, partial [Diploptera punctata]